jgi:N-acetylglucosamine-6-phosphate deacetylase
LTLEDGTLAGANLDLFTAVDFIVQVVGLAPEEALRMASLYPASILGRSSELGCLESGAKADFIWMQESTKIKAIWQQGRPVT